MPLLLKEGLAVRIALLLLLSVGAAPRSNAIFVW